jgi:hypothetical protein
VKSDRTESSRRNGWHRRSPPQKKAQGGEQYCRGSSVHQRSLSSASQQGEHMSHSHWRGTKIFVNHTSAFYHPPSCSGTNNPRLFTPTFGTHHVPSSKTTLAILPMRICQRFHPVEGPPRESTNYPPLHQPSTQSIPTITKDPEHPTFRDIPEVQLHQPAHISTTTTRPSQSSGAASSTQTLTDACTFANTHGARKHRARSGPNP